MSRKTKIGLVQINNSFSGQSYFPYSVGILQAYAQQHLLRPDDFEFLLPIYSRISVDYAVEQLLHADLVGFSLYVWNNRISLQIAARLKAKKPEVIIFCGGPHVPDRAEEFLRNNPFVDIACHGEGEKVFVSILENAPDGNLDKVPSISYLTKAGVFMQTQRAGRIKDLAAVPSPFLEGTFGPLIQAYPDENWIAVWETNRGCPFSCTFCDWGSAVAAKVNSWDLARLYREIEWFADHKIEFIFCADANFGILPRDVDIASRCAEVKQQRGFPQAISVQNTKNATEPFTQSRLNTYCMPAQACLQFSGDRKSSRRNSAAGWARTGSSNETIRTRAPWSTSILTSGIPIRPVPPATSTCLPLNTA